jgi:hypothetical protein
MKILSYLNPITTNQSLPIDRTINTLMVLKTFWKTQNFVKFTDISGIESVTIYYIVPSQNICPCSAIIIGERFC